MATPLTKPSDLTTNTYKKAKVVALIEHIEEDVTLIIDGTTINCFASYCPYELEVGKTYDVELTLNLSENYEIERTGETNTLIKHTNRGYSYVLYGDLHNEILMSFTSLNVEGVHYDHPECNDHFIKLKVERIDACFH